MKFILSNFLVMLALVAFTPATAFAQTDDMDMDADKSILELAMETPELSTLVAAVKAADLVTPLSGNGPFTVFAPTNAAFENLPSGVLNALLMPENKASLAKILQYHVASANLMAEDITNAISDADNGMYMANTMNGDFTAMMNGGSVAIKDGMGNVANVTATDIAATNGTVHLIDRVLLPKGLDMASLMKNSATGMVNNTKDAVNNTMDSAEETAENMANDGKKVVNNMKQDADRMAETTVNTTRQVGTDVRNNMTYRDENSVVAVAGRNNDFSTFNTALTAAEYNDVFANGETEYTIFAPSNDAFNALPSGTVEDLTRTENKEKLQGVLQYHVIPSRITGEQLTAAIKANRGYYRLQMMDGNSLIASVKDGKIILTDGNGDVSTITASDMDGSNGTIHTVDRVLMTRKPQMTYDSDMDDNDMDNDGMN